jgi:hypothetical protein
MKVSRIDKNNDWTFGRSKANYLRQSKAIGQNVKTRLRSFEQDWVHDVNAGIPWVNLLGSLGTERRILRAVERTVLQTRGVVSVGRLEIVRRDANRGITIEFDYTDVFGEAIADRLEFEE